MNYELRFFALKGQYILAQWHRLGLQKIPQSIFALKGQHKKVGWFIFFYHEGHEGLIINYQLGIIYQLVIHKV